MDTPDFALLYRIARQYYEDHLSQEEIAQAENISRPHVSRMLQKARDCGIVNIEVRAPFTLEEDELARTLRARFGGVSFTLVPVAARAWEDRTRLAQTIATAGAELLPRLLAGAETIGVGWGQTVYQTTQYMARTTRNATTTVVPLVGISGGSNPYLQNNVIVDRLAEKLRSASYYTSLSAFHDSRAALPQEDLRYTRLKEQWQQVDCAVIGLGAACNGALQISDASDEYRKFIAGSGTVGDILAQFFYPDGTIVDSSAYYRQISFSLEKLKTLPRVICLAGGADKVPGLVAAARNRFFNTLVTDTETARAMLAYEEAL